jgi:hypothetical protein
MMDIRDPWGNDLTTDRRARLAHLAMICEERATQLRRVLWQPWAKDRALSRAAHYEARAERLRAARAV